METVSRSWFACSLGVQVPAGKPAWCLAALGAPSKWVSPARTQLAQSLAGFKPALTAPGR